MSGIMSSTMRAAARGIVTMLLWLAASAAQAANCVPSNITLFTVTPVNMGNYSPVFDRAADVVVHGDDRDQRQLHQSLPRRHGSRRHLCADRPGARLHAARQSADAGQRVKINVNNTTVDAHLHASASLPDNSRRPALTRPRTRPRSASTSTSSQQGNLIVPPARIGAGRHHRQRAARLPIAAAEPVDGRLHGGADDRTAATRPSCAR